VKSLSLFLVTAVLISPLVLTNCKKKTDETVTPEPPAPVVFTNGQAASGVIGQSDFISSTSTVGKTGVDEPAGVALVGGKLIYNNTGFSEAFLYNTTPTMGGTADVQIGTQGTAADQLKNPHGVAFDNGKLFIADTSNYRVQIFSTIPTADFPSANFAIGQSGPGVAANPGGGVSSTTLSAPWDVSVGGGKMVISDSGYNRVTLYNTIPTGNQAAANLALGQMDLNSSAAGTGVKMNYPNGVWTDGTRIAVADTNNHRVLIWNTWPTASGQTPDVILGQPDINGNTMNNGGVSGSSLYSPGAVTSDGTSLYVVDFGNHRVLGWSSWPTTINAAADIVLGQADFTTANNPTTPSATNMKDPFGLAVDGDNLYVSDYSFNRILIFTKH
jgi:hypothetical protein